MVEVVAEDEVDTEEEVLLFHVAPEEDTEVVAELLSVGVELYIGSTIDLRR